MDEAFFHRQQALNKRFLAPLGPIQGFTEVLNLAERLGQEVTHIDHFHITNLHTFAHLLGLMAGVGHQFGAAIVIAVPGILHLACGLAIVHFVFEPRRELVVIIIVLTVIVLIVLIIIIILGRFGEGRFLALLLALAPVLALGREVNSAFRHIGERLDEISRRLLFVGFALAQLVIQFVERLT